MILNKTYFKLSKIDSFLLLPVNAISWAALNFLMLLIIGCTGIQSSNPIARSKAIEKKEFPQARLAKHALYDNSLIVRMAAVNKLTDQTLLAKIVEEGKTISVCKAAMERLTDQVLLEHITVTDKRREIRQEAMTRLTDQALLMKIAEEDSRLEICMEAVKKITDQAFLSKIAANDRQPEIRMEAVKKITDQAFLSKIAANDRQPEIRMEAVNNITDQDLLAKLAMEGNHEEISLIAINKLTDQALLSKLAIEEQKLSVRKEVWNRLTDPVLLAKAVKTVEHKKPLALYRTVPKIRLVLTEEYDKKGENFEVDNLKPITEFIELIGFKLSQEKTAPTLYVTVTAKPRLVRYNYPQWFAGNSTATVTFQVSSMLTLNGSHNADFPSPYEIPSDKETYPLRKSNIWKFAGNVACVAILDAIRNAGDPAIPVLTKALTHEEMRVRIAAVHALQKTESLAAIYPLVNALRDKEFDTFSDFGGEWAVSEAALKAIEAYGKAAAEPLFNLCMNLPTNDWGTASRIFWYIQKLLSEIFPDPCIWLKQQFQKNNFDPALINLSLNC